MMNTEQNKYFHVSLMGRVHKVSFKSWLRGVRNTHTRNFYFCSEKQANEAAEAQRNLIAQQQAEQKKWAAEMAAEMGW